MNNDVRIQTVCLIILSAIGIATSLYLLKQVLIPFVLAVFLTYSLTPIIEFMIRFLRIRRSLAIVVTVFLACLVLFFLSTFISSTIYQMSSQTVLYQEEIKESLQRMINYLPLSWLGIETKDLLSNAPLEINQSYISNFLGMTFGSIMNIISNGILVIIFMMFMMLGKQAENPPSIKFLDDLQFQITRYIVTLVIISALTGVLVGFVLQILGVKFAMMFGFLTFLLNFIPNIGSIIATLLPIPVAIISPDLSVGAKIMVVVIPSAIQFTLGNIVQPKMMGESLDLHPVVVMISLIFFGMIWGIVGMFLATPITGIVKILLEKIELTKPIADALSGRLEPLLAFTEADEIGMPKQE